MLSSLYFLLCVKLISASIISNGFKSNIPSSNLGNNFKFNDNIRNSPQNGLGLQNNLASNNAGFAANRLSGFRSNVGIGQSGLNNIGFAQKSLNNLALAQNSANLGTNRVGSQNNYGLSQNNLITNTLLAAKEQNAQNNLELAQNIANEVNAEKMALTQYVGNSGTQRLAQNSGIQAAQNLLGNDAVAIANFGKNAFNSPLAVASRSPNFPGVGLRVLADALEVAGYVAVTGKMPLSGTVEVNGNVPTDGTATVSYSCGSES